MGANDDDYITSNISYRCWIHINRVSKAVKHND